MTTTTKVVVAVVSAAAVGTLVYMYVNKKGVFHEASGNKKLANASPPHTPADLRYPAHTWIDNGKVRGWTGQDGKII
jgi:hypothetical protein